MAFKEHFTREKGDQKLDLGLRKVTAYHCFDSIMSVVQSFPEWITARPRRIGNNQTFTYKQLTKDRYGQEYHITLDSYGDNKQYLSVTRRESQSSPVDWDKPLHLDERVEIDLVGDSPSIRYYKKNQGTGILTLQSENTIDTVRNANSFSQEFTKKALLRSSKGNRKTLS